MAFNVINWARRIPYIRPVEKFVLVTLADSANKDGACYPGVRSIAEDCNLSGRQMQRLIRQLEFHGLIVTYQRFRENGSSSSLNYQLQITIDPPTWQPPGTKPAQLNTAALLEAFRQLLQKRMTDNGQEQQFFTWLASLRILCIEKTRVKFKVPNDTIRDHVRLTYSSLLLQVAQESISPGIRKIYLMSQKSGS